MQRAGSLAAPAARFRLPPVARTSGLCPRQNSRWGRRCAILQPIRRAVQYSWERRTSAPVESSGSRPAITASNRGRIVHRSRKRADAVQRRRKSDQPIARNPSIGGHHARNPAKRARLANRSARIRAQARSRPCPAATAAADPPLEPPGNVIE